MVNIGVGGTWFSGLKTSLLSVKNALVKLLLQVSKFAVCWESARNVSGVEAVYFNACINKKQFSVRNYARVSHPVQNWRVLAGSNNRVVSNFVALFASHRVKSAFNHAFGMFFSKRLRQSSKHAVKTELCCGNSFAHFSNFVIVFKHSCFCSKFMQFVVGGTISVFVRKSACFAHCFNFCGKLRVCFSNDSNANAFTVCIVAYILGNSIVKFSNIARFNTGHGFKFLQACTWSNPIFSVVRIFIEC